MSTPGGPEPGRPIAEIPCPTPDALRPATLAGCSAHAARQETRGRLKIFLGARPGVGKTYEMLAGGRRQEAEGWTSSSASSRPTAARRRRRWSRARDRAATGARLQGAPSRGDGPRRDPEARPAARPRRRARPYQCRRQPASQALHGCGGTARGRHRRVHDHERPARGEPQRRGGADHPHPRARDRAGCDHRAGGRHRGDRHHASGPDPETERRQGLRAPDRRSARWPITSRPAT